MKASKLGWSSERPDVLQYLINDLPFPRTKIARTVCAATVARIVSRDTPWGWIASRFVVPRPMAYSFLLVEPSEIVPDFCGVSFFTTDQSWPVLSFVGLTRNGVANWKGEMFENEVAHERGLASEAGRGVFERHRRMPFVMKASGW